MIFFDFFRATWLTLLFCLFLRAQDSQFSDFCEEATLALAPQLLKVLALCPLSSYIAHVYHKKCNRHVRGDQSAQRLKFINTVRSNDSVLWVPPSHTPLWQRPKRFNSAATSSSPALWHFSIHSTCALPSVGLQIHCSLAIRAASVSSAPLPHSPLLPSSPHLKAVLSCWALLLLLLSSLPQSPLGSWGLLLLFPFFFCQF